MNITMHEDNDSLILTVKEDRIDAPTAVAFKDQVRALAGTGAQRVILDLAQVSFIDSSGLGAIVGSMKALGRERALELAALQPAVANVFHLTRMDEVFAIHASAEAAFAAGKAARI